MNRVTAILPAAGLGTRMGADTPKQFLSLDGVPCLFLRCGAWRPALRSRISSSPREPRKSIPWPPASPRKILAGPFAWFAAATRARIPSPTRWRKSRPRPTLILVHDAVRPLVTLDQIERVIAEADACDAAILGIPAMDTVKEVKRASLPTDVALITATIPRERVVLAQTPQVFRASLLLEAIARARQDGVTASDEAGLVERMGRDVHVVVGSERNLKITRPGDMELAEFYLRQERAGR